MILHREIVKLPDQPAQIPKRGFLRDYVSGKHIRSTPEQTDAVQLLSRRLVEDYGYPRTHLQTQPQYRVRRSPSDDGKHYPVDIAIFNKPDRLETQAYIIAECKSKNKVTGLEQLELYMTMSRAVIGIWYNGDDHAYIRKLVHPDGTVTFQDIPTLPRYGERLEDIGQHKRKQLRIPTNLRAIFRDLRNHLAANAVGLTRDEPIAQEIINLLFCKIYDELNTHPDLIVTFRSGSNEPSTAVRERILKLFEKVKNEYFDVFADADHISLDAASIVYIVGELQNYSITTATRDAVGDAFEVFIGPALRGAEGQFFTPRNVVNMIVDMIDPKPGEMIIDPACGSGGFLIASLEHVWKYVNVEGESKAWDAIQIDRRRRDVATRYYRGIDKDMFLAKVTKAYMALVGDGRGGVFCEDSLTAPGRWSGAAQAAIKLGEFDVVLTNPPFGTKIKVEGADKIIQYDLGRKWRRNGSTSQWERSNVLENARPPQVLFLERCLQLLKPGGRLGIVLPESMLGMPTHSYIIQYLMSRARVRAVIAMPEALFKTSGKGGTHTKVCVVLIENTPPSGDYPIFMADARWCGHDSRGNPTIRILPDETEELLDDTPHITARFHEMYDRSGGFWTDGQP